MKCEFQKWSYETFGQADLGDERRVRRLVQMGSRAAERPNGRLSQVFKSTAEREGAYDFVENKAITEVALGRTVFEATARASAAHPFVVVPLDGTSLKLWDGTGSKDFGRIGTHQMKATGLKVMNGLAISPDGIPIGVAAQTWWKRVLQRKKKRHHESRRLAQKETKYWIQAITQVDEAFTQYAPNTAASTSTDDVGLCHPSLTL
jgi:hypothetical protein